MRNFRPARLGEDDDWFGFVETSPGRIDPRSGELIESTTLPSSKAEGMFDWLETSPGRVNPRSGALVVPTGLTPEQRGRLKRPGTGLSPSRRPMERSLSRFGGGESDPFKGMRQLEHAGARSAAPGGIMDFFGSEMNGPHPKIGCDTCGGMGDAGSGDGPGIALWLFLGVGTAVALEAFGVTSWSKKV